MKYPLHGCHPLHLLRFRDQGVQREHLDAYCGLALTPRTHLRHFRFNNKLFLFLRDGREAEFLAELEQIPLTETRNRRLFENALRELRLLMEWIQIEQTVAALRNL